MTKRLAVLAALVAPILVLQFLSPYAHRNPLWLAMSMVPVAATTVTARRFAGGDSWIKALAQAMLAALALWSLVSLLPPSLFNESSALVAFAAIATGFWGVWWFLAPVR